MRPLLLAVAALAISPVHAQSGAGNYKPAGGQAAAWSINENHTLIWNQQPYMPVGLRIDGTPAEIAAAKAAGVSDVIVQMPATGMGWKDAFTALESAQMRYLVDISSLAPMAKGYAVEPQGYRISGINSKRLIEAKIPGALSALAVLITQRDASVEKVMRVPVVDGKISVELSPLNDLEHVLLIYPEMRSLEQPDLWDAMDEHRDTLITSLKKTPPGSGLRGIVNPMGTMLQLTRGDLRFIPSSPYFRYELRTFLENKYKNVETAMKGWSMSSAPIKTFDDLSRLVPLWSGTRGISQFWDPSNDELYICDSKRSTVWKDIQTVVTSAADRRYQRLVGAIQTAVDVPILQEWAGWAAAYEGATPSLDGIGMRASGTSPSAITDSASRAASSILRWQKPGWLAATSVDLGSSKESIGLLSAVLDDLTSLGARGWFVEARGNPELAKAVGGLARQRASDVAAASYGPQPVFFPENALNPASTQRLGGRWWLPSPGDGNRIDLGAGFNAYRIQDGKNNYVALWSDEVRGRIKLRIVNTKGATFESVDGTDPKPKFVRGGVEVTVGSLPLIIRGIDEIPVPEPAYAETLRRFDALAKTADRLHADATEERYYLKEALDGFDRNPGGSFATMRVIYWRLSQRMAHYSWIEAESTRDYNFSEIVPAPGCSAQPGGNGEALALRTQLSTADQVFTANYNVPVRTDEDQEVWIAARIPARLRDSVKVLVGSQVLSIDGEPVSIYGAGYGWYKLGVTRLTGNFAKIKLQVTAPDGADLAVDTILFYNGSFRPSGVTRPDAIDFPVSTKKGG